MLCAYKTEKTNLKKKLLSEVKVNLFLKKEPKVMQLDDYTK